MSGESVLIGSRVFCAIANTSCSWGSVKQFMPSCYLPNKTSFQLRRPPPYINIYYYLSFFIQFTELVRLFTFVCCQTKNNFTAKYRVTWLNSSSSFDSITAVCVQKRRCFSKLYMTVLLVFRQRLACTQPRAVCLLLKRLRAYCVSLAIELVASRYLLWWAFKRKSYCYFVSSFNTTV
jgi:hypothetical protein